MVLEAGELGEETFDFCEADLVDLVGWEVGGGVVPDEQGVFGTAFRPTPGTDPREAGREVVVGEKGLELAIGGNDLIADGGEGGGGEALAFCLGHGDGEFAQGAVKGAVLGLGNELFFEGQVDAFDDLARLNHPPVDAFTEEGDGASDFVGQIVKQADPVFNVSDRFEVEGGGVFIEQVNAVAGAEDEQVEVSVVFGMDLLKVLAKEGGVELAFGREVGGSEEGIEFGE